MESGASASETPSEIVETGNVSNLNLGKRRRTVYNDEERLKMRRLVARRYKARILIEAKRALMEEKEVGSFWKPERVKEIEPSIGLTFSMRFKCEQYCRAYTAFLGVQNGVRVRQTTLLVQMKCHATGCRAKIKFDRRACDGQWKLTRFKSHESSCFGVDTSLTNDTTSKASKHCIPAYTSEQVARVLVMDSNCCPSTSEERNRNNCSCEGYLRSVT